MNRLGGASSSDKSFKKSSSFMTSRREKLQFIPSHCMFVLPLGAAICQIVKHESCSDISLPISLQGYFLLLNNLFNQENIRVIEGLSLGLYVVIFRWHWPFRNNLSIKQQTYDQPVYRMGKNPHYCSPHFDLNPGLLTTLISKIKVKACN